jgi:DNA-binding CsgD family transcriptional regulator
MSQLRSFLGLRGSTGIDGAYRRFVEAFGRADLGTAVDAAFSAIAPIDRFYVYDQMPDFATPPTILAARYESCLADRVHHWSDRFRFTDPVRKALAAAQEPGAMVVLKVGPGDISEADYRIPFFDKAQIVERLSIVQRQADRWLVVHAARRRATGPFGERDVAAMAGLAQLVLPLALRQRDLLVRRQRPDAWRAEDLERRFVWLCPKMTRRERQVCARALLGMTTEATALDLGIGGASVQTYRRRAYARLGISSSYQLARLLLN